MVYSEQTLERVLKCPMMSLISSSKKELCSYALASWALRRSFEGKLFGKPDTVLPEIRGKVIELWKSNNVEGDPGVIARTAGFRIFTLLTDYEVLHVEEPYNLSLAGYTIQGRYAMMRKRKGEKLPYVLILHTYEPNLKQQATNPPDVPTLSRYVHATTNGGYVNAQVLHYPILSGRMWMNKIINNRLAVKYLQSMLEVASVKASHPIPGDYCNLCTKPCLEVFHE